MAADDNLSPDQFPEVIDRAPHALRQWAADKPHTAAIQVAQNRTAFDHPNMRTQLPEPEWAYESHQAGPVLEHMLTTAGYPADEAQGAYVMRHRDRSGSASNPSSFEGKPGVTLHPERWDYGTMAHEAAHHVTMRQNGWSFNDHTLGDAEKHGPQFAENYARTLSVVSKGAGEDFRRHHADATQLVRNYRARILGIRDAT